MTSEADLSKSQSLHYAVKAFLVSAPLTVQLERKSELDKVHLSSSFKFPPPLGPHKKYALNWSYFPDEVEISEVWAEKVRGPVAVTRSSEKIDLVQFFWGSGAEDSPPKDGPVLWRGEEIFCRGLEKVGRDFSFVIERRGKKVVEAKGSWGSDGMLSTLKLSLSLPIKLGAITIERADV